MKLLVFGILFFSTSAFSQYDYSQAIIDDECTESAIICSEYTLGGHPAETRNVCEEEQNENYIGNPLVCPMIREANDAGYRMMEIATKHGIATVIEYNGVQINLGFDFMALLEPYDFKTPEIYETNLANWEADLSVYEYRYQKENDESRKPFAMIYRYDYQATVYSEIEGREELKEPVSTLFIVKLDGANTAIIGTVDSIKAWQNDVSANTLARECADSIVGAGNSDSCTVYKTH